jgi:hypothetical protein
MKRFCLPGLPYSQCMIWPSFRQKLSPAQYPDNQKNTPGAIHTNQQDWLSPHAMNFTGS